MLKCSANKFNKICAEKHPDRDCVPDTQRLPGDACGPSLPACSGCMLVRDRSMARFYVDTAKLEADRSDIECGRVNRPILSAPKAALDVAN
jgi:hypothetical protein